jgi:hypothetical protein
VGGRFDTLAQMLSQSRHVDADCVIGNRGHASDDTEEWSGPDRAEGPEPVVQNGPMAQRRGRSTLPDEEPARRA